MGDRVLHGGGFVAAVHHAIGAFLVISRAVGIPVGLLHQLAERFGVAFPEEIAGPLPAEDGPRRISPRRAMIGLITGKKIEEEARLAERPGLAAAAARENVAEQLLGGGAVEKVLLI